MMHLACERNHPVAVLELLYEADPDCLEYNNRGNDNSSHPLFAAIRAGCSVETLDWLLDRTALLPDFFDDAILPRSVQLALTCPQASAALCERLLVMMTCSSHADSGGGLPLLHWFLLEQQQQQGGCRSRNDDEDGGDAFFRQQQRLELLLRQCPQAARRADDQGRLPIHIAAAGFPRAAAAVGLGSAGGGIPLAALKLLVDTHPTGLLTPNHQGQLPLHVLLTDESNNRTDDDDDDDDAGRGKKNRRNHRSRRRRRHHPSLSLPVLNLFLEAPGGTTAALMRHADCEGRLPLHVACQQSSRWCSNARVLQRLVDADPAALHHQSTTATTTTAATGHHDGLLSPMLTAARHGAPLEVIWFWARRSPELIFCGAPPNKVNNNDKKNEQKIAQQQESRDM